MVRYRITAPILLALLSGCSRQPEAAAATASAPAREPASSEMRLAAVDARTGQTLADPELTVRYLVRAPVTLDAAAVEHVPSGEPYRIVHAITTDSLVVELRLEAPSYQRLDTVLAVGRGGSAGPLKLALTPRTPTTGAPAAPPTSVAAAAPAPKAAPSASAPASRADETLDASVDRGGIRDGDAAFARQDWRGAVTGYRRMPPPRARSGAYGREYQLATVRMGISLINLGQFPGALDALRDAAEFPFREYTVYFYLGQVECTLGQFDAGRRSLGQIDRLASTISNEQRPIVLALTDYQRGVCSHAEFQQARTPADQQKAATRALDELDAFLQKGEAMQPVPPPVAGAVADARKRMQQIAGR